MSLDAIKHTWPDPIAYNRLASRSAPAHSASPAASQGACHIAAVIPAFNRADDLQALLNDLAAMTTTTATGVSIHLSVTIADNASIPPLSASITPPASLRVEFVRLDVNAGGSGGFNAAMSHVLCRRGMHPSQPPPDLLLLLDSDARLTRDCVRTLAQTLHDHPSLIAVGPALRDLTTGKTYEIGGCFDSSTGRAAPVVNHDVSPDVLVSCDYVASCCLLVRADAVKDTGLFPDVFLYLDDIDWCLALQASTRGSIAAVPAAIAYHPWWWRSIVSAKRYFLTRNAFLPLRRRNADWRARARSALKECKDACSISLLGFGTLASEHAQGLRDAAFGPREGRGRAKLPPAPRALPLADMDRTLHAFVEQFTSALGRAPRIFVHPAFCSTWMGFDELRETLARLDLHPESCEIWHSRSPAALLLNTAWRAVKHMLGFTQADLAIIPGAWLTAWIHAPHAYVIEGESFVEVTIKPWRTLPATLALIARLVLPLLMLVVKRQPPAVLARPWALDDASAERIATS